MLPADDALMVLACVSVVALVSGLILATRNPLLLLLALPGFVLLLLGWGYVASSQDIVRDQAPSPAAPIWMTADPALATLIPAVAGISWIIGALGVAMFAQPSRSFDLGVERIRSAFMGKRMYQRALLLVAWAATVAFALVYGPVNVFFRESYDATRAIPSLAGAAGVLVPLAFAMGIFGLIMARKGLRTPWVLLLTVQTILVAGTASRLLAVLPLFWIGLTLLLRGRVRIRQLVIAAFCVFAAAAFVLAARMLPVGMHGLVNYIGALLDGRLELNVAGGVADLYTNVLFALPLAAYVAGLAQFTWSDLALSLSLIPSSGDEWAERSRDLRAHAYIPFNSLGELASLSLFTLGAILLAYTLVVCAIVVNLQRRGRAISTALLLVLFYFSFLLSLQYNLRASSRIAILVVLLGSILVLWPRSKTRQGNPKLSAVDA